MAIKGVLVWFAQAMASFQDIRRFREPKWTVKAMSPMTVGLNNEPKGAYLPSVTN